MMVDKVIQFGENIPHNLDFSEWFLLVGQGVAVVGCVAAPLVTIWLVLLTMARSPLLPWVSNDATLLYVGIVMAGLLAFCLSQAFAFVFARARLMGRLLRQPEILRYLNRKPGSNGRETNERGSEPPAGQPRG